MVGDIIQDPLGGLVNASVVAGAWAIGSAINAYKQNYDFVTDYGRDFLNNKFTTDDLVDVPPPPAEDLGTVVPDAPPSEGGQSSSGSSGKTFEELATELVQNEAKNGIQSPLGPEDPNFVSVPVQQEQGNKDPQAPLKPGFAPSPQPAPGSTLDANLILAFRSPGGPYPPTPTSGLVYYPVFRGQAGSKKAISQENWDVYGVPRITDGEVKWIARIQAKANGRVVATWDINAGSKPPQAGEVDLRTTQTVLDFDSSLLDYPQGVGYSLKTFPLQQSAAPPLIPNPPNPGESNTSDLLASAIPSFSPNRPPWTSALVDPPAESENLPGGGLPLDLLLPGLAPTPVVPPTAVPINPNNPVANPAIGANGLPLQNIAQIVQTGTDVHKIGELTVNSGKIRATTASIAKEVGRIEQKSAALQKGQNSIWDNIGQLGDVLLLLELLRQLLEQDLPPKALTLNPVCEDEADSTTVVLPAEKYMDRIQSSLDALPVLLQAHLGYKTPTCGNEKPELLGQWVTTRWESDEKMVDSGRRLRKLFRYRTQSARDLGQLSDYWRDFTWKSGPVCVIHKGAWWGTPQVWAESAEEGKRVIRHAAAEAGIDPDQVGGWTISSSRSPRNGMSGTMRILKKEGFPWVASRQGADWPNMLAK